MAVSLRNLPIKWLKLIFDDLVIENEGCICLQVHVLRLKAIG
jgi:hypothetical protein